jgi:RNA polymerase sigma factor (sigma-70 family)
LTSEKDIESTVKKNQGKLFGFIRKRVSSNEDAEDILQEVWYQLSRLINLDDIENVSAWLYRVTRNKITDWYKKPKNVPTDAGLFEGEEGSMIREVLFGDHESQEDKFFKDLFWSELMKGLNALPPNQREVFIKNELEGMKLREIAERSNENIKTIISRKQYAVKHLRSILKDLYDELLN